MTSKAWQCLLQMMLSQLLCITSSQTGYESMSYLRTLTIVFASAAIVANKISGAASVDDATYGKRILLEESVAILTDGDVSTCTTLMIERSLLTIDLGRFSTIEKVSFHTSEMQQITVYSSAPDEQPTSNICYAGAILAGHRQQSTFRCASPVMGDHLFVHLNVTAMKTLCEIQVFLSGDNENIALNRSATLKTNSEYFTSENRCRQMRQKRFSVTINLRRSLPIHSFFITNTVGEANVTISIRDDSLLSRDGSFCRSSHLLVNQTNVITCRSIRTGTLVVFEFTMTGSEFTLCRITTVHTVDGQWGEWIPYSACSVTCGSGLQFAMRSCNAPPNQGGGRYCDGLETSELTCTRPLCPVRVDGAWTSWFEYSSCSVTCGNGTEALQRGCDDPAPSGGGVGCVGESSRTVNCSRSICNESTATVDWGRWSTWAACSVTCGNGTRNRTRDCPSGGCSSNFTMTSPCSIACLGGVQKTKTIISAGVIVVSVMSCLLALLLIAMVALIIVRLSCPQSKPSRPILVRNSGEIHKEEKEPASQRASLTNSDASITASSVTAVQGDSQTVASSSSDQLDIM